MKLPKFEYIRPKSAKEASSFLKENKAKAMPVAGGSDLLVNLKNRLQSPQFLVDLKALPGLDEISFSPSEGLSIGAMATLRDLIENPTVRAKYPILVQAAEAVGTPQLQFMGTISGNLCLDNRCYYYNQSPLWHQGRDACYKLAGKTCYVVKGSKDCWATYCGDTAPALLALGAKVKIADPIRAKTMPLQDLYSGDGKNPLTLTPGQFVTQVIIPPPSSNSGGAYLKLRRRQAIDFPSLGIAVTLQLNGKGNTCQDIQVAMTAVEKAPITIPEASSLKGKAIDEKTIADVLEVARNKAHPLDNILSFPPSYRKDMVRVYLKRAILQARDNAQKK